MDCDGKQFSYCILCRLNHKDKKKHSFSKKHQDIISKIINKFSKKISDCERNLREVVIKPRGFEANLRLWCYFCNADVTQHSVHGLFTVVDGGFITHLSTNEHAQNSLRFIRENCLKDEIARFIVNDDSYGRFLEKVKAAINSSKKDRNIKLKQIQCDIETSEARRAHFSQRVFRATKPSARESGPWVGETLNMSSSTYPASGGGKYTTSASGDGLSTVKLPRTSGRAGNVHSGALPPWFQGNDGCHGDRSDNREIGPSQADLDRHLADERRRRLPANRVGATFRHGEATPSSWLPMFGRVWSHHRRWDSKKMFERLQQSHMIGSAPTNRAITQYGASPSFAPYRRKAATGNTHQNHIAPSNIQLDGHTLCKNTPSTQRLVENNTSVSHNSKTATFQHRHNGGLASESSSSAMKSRGNQMSVNALVSSLNESFAVQRDTQGLPVDQSDSCNYGYRSRKRRARVMGGDDSYSQKTPDLTSHFSVIPLNVS